MLCPWLKAKIVQEQNTRNARINLEQSYISADATSWAQTERYEGLSLPSDFFGAASFGGIFTFSFDKPSRRVVFEGPVEISFIMMQCIGRDTSNGTFRKIVAHNIEATGAYLTGKKHWDRRTQTKSLVNASSQVHV
jgi:hypothetical protein